MNKRIKKKKAKMAERRQKQIMKAFGRYSQMIEEANKKIDEAFMEIVLFGQATIHINKDLTWK